MLGKEKVQLQMRAMKCACFFALSPIGPRMLILLLLEKLFTSVTKGMEKQQTIFNKLQPYVQVQCSLFLLQVWLGFCCKDFLLQIVFSLSDSSLPDCHPNTSQKPQADVFLTSESVLWTFTLLRVCQLLKGRADLVIVHKIVFWLCHPKANT